MVDYSAFAPAHPPAAPASAGYAQEHRDPSPSHAGNGQGYGQGHGGLAGQFGSLSMAQQSSQGTRAPPPPSLAPPLDALPPATYARAPSPGGYPASGQASAAYSAANRQRPQLSPVLTNTAFPPASAQAPPRGYQLHDGRSPSSSSSFLLGAGAVPRAPRKSSLPASSSGPSSTTFAHQPHPPLPSLPSSSPSYPQFPASSAQSSLNGAQRDSSGGEQVFNGAALAVGDTRESVASSSRSASSVTATAAKRANPLADLIATETAYVEDLGVIIKRVAAAWSRANFPPPVLDSMFRAIEAVYRVNKSLLAKLLEIGPSPSSPKALGDLLMRWIDDIEPSYTRYASTLQGGYDTHAPVQANKRLAPILASLPWPSTLPEEDVRPVTLDALFALPAVRVAYYQRLYAKLLRSTQEGRSDHALLVSANDKLRHLAALCDEARTRTLDGTAPTLPLAPPVLREERKQGPSRIDVEVLSGARGVQAAQSRSSGESARIDSPSSSSYRSSGATGVSTANTSATNTLHSGAPLRVEDLEHRLDTARTLDIFTMQPRKCKLQMQPPSLAFARQLRKAGPVTLSFVPSSDPSGRDIHVARAHLVLLTDLFLVCTPVEAADAHAAVPGADFWLLYPPLAGKHLRVRDGPTRGSFEVAIMGKERLTFRPLDAAGGGAGVSGAGEEQQTREWRVALDEAIRFGATQAQQPGRQDSSASGSGASPVSPTYRSSPLTPSFQTSVQPPTAPNSAAPSPHSAYSQPSPHSLPPVSASTGSSGRPQLQLLPPGQAPPLMSSDGVVPRPERNASMLSSGSRAPSANGGGYTGGPFVQSPTGSASHSFGGPGSSRGPSPYPTSDSSAYGRQSPNPQPQSQFAPGQGYAHDFAPPPPIQQHGQPAYPTYPLPQSPHLSNDGPSSSSRPISGQSNGSYASSQASSRYPDFDPRAAPPPLPKERSYNGVDISGRGGPLYPTSLNGAPRSMGGRLAPAPGLQGGPIHRSRSAEVLRPGPGHPHSHAHGGNDGFGSQYRMPSEALLEDRSASAPGAPRTLGGVGAGEYSPPTSPVDERPRQPDKTAVVAQMRCKIFLQQHHSQWKSLGTAKLKLFHSMPSGTKQLVVDSDKGGGKTVISTIVLTDGVERVGKTGVAIELSDQGDRTGIVYMLQMKTEQSATGLFEQLLVGTDRAGR